MKISDWPSAERPREKLLAKGAAALSDAELLAIFIHTGVQGKTALDLARQLINDFGGLRPLLESERAQFCQHPGLGSAKYALLQASLEITKRHLFETLQRGKALKSPNDTRQFLTAQLRRYTHEVFACLFLDTGHRIIGFKELIHGTLNKAEVHPREVVKQALKHNAAAVIFAHNHPSGMAIPSDADKYVTQLLQQSLALIDIKVLDHLIIGDGQDASFVELGLL